MPKSANHNTIIFVRRRHSIAICIVANVVISIRKEEVVDEHVDLIIKISFSRTFEKLERVPLGL